MGCYLQADVYWKVSFVVLNTYKRKCQQTNIRLKWTIYYTTINNELFRFKRLMGFWTDITSLTSFASNSSLLLTFLAFDILLNSVFWSKITRRTGKRTSINYKINGEKSNKYNPWKLRTFIYHEFTKYNIIFSRHNGICFLHLWWAKNSKGYALIITKDENHSLFLQKSHFKDPRYYLVRRAFKVQANTLIYDI